MWHVGAGARKLPLWALVSGSRKTRKRLGNHFVLQHVLHITYTIYAHSAIRHLHSALCTGRSTVCGLHFALALVSPADRVCGRGRRTAWPWPWWAAVVVVVAQSGKELSHNEGGWGSADGLKMAGSGRRADLLHPRRPPTNYVEIQGAGSKGSGGTAPRNGLPRSPLTSLAAGHLRAGLSFTPRAVGLPRPRKALQSAALGEGAPPRPLLRQV
jgi:hypothetical protein